MTAQNRTVSNRTRALLHWFENLQSTDVARMGQYYADPVFFKDPFNEVSSLAAVKHIFDDMFKRVDQPRFVVTTAIEQGDDCFLTWDFLFNTKGGKPWVIRGASHLRYDAAGLVAFHRDYWDAAEELYEKLPLIGALMRWLKKRAG
jgi:steroid Delta-isomerase